MKISLALLVLLLAAAWAGRPGMSFRSSKVMCCPKEKFSRGRIPEDKILEYHYTSPTCTHKAVLVTMPRGMVCVDPEEKWFQKYLRKQKKPNSTSK
ncbi:C-C motif chemokine 5-like [Corvus cornix cornix]|uniref:C-C motif chemokine 5-like n=1 Tax=Corvus cornix cornix TaxID=932674 RepID=UPI0005341D33|nr:C-C motif chemokine 5-like [Corvus cornix cornix]XP_017598576.1 PREDICTED: C-C motif chemokine 5-like [Corvus brachyrhynchos]XP_048180568.1 C-C motif chemokine 5-like [Corvus hawaiiensis]